MKCGLKNRRKTSGKFPQLPRHPLQAAGKPAKRSREQPHRHAKGICGRNLHFSGSHPLITIAINQTRSNDNHAPLENGSNPSKRWVLHRLLSVIEGETRIHPSAGSKNALEYLKGLRLHTGLGRLGQFNQPVKIDPVIHTEKESRQLVDFFFPVRCRGHALGDQNETQDLTWLRFHGWKVPFPEYFRNPSWYLRWIFRPRNFRDRPTHHHPARA